MKKFLIFLLLPMLSFASNNFCEDEAKAYAEQTKIANEAEELFEKNKTNQNDTFADYFAVIDIYTNGLKALHRPERVAEIFERFQSRDDFYAYATRICLETSLMLSNGNAKSTEAQILSLVKEAKNKSKNGSKEFTEALCDVLKNGNPLIKPSGALTKAVKELIAKSDK